MLELAKSAFEKLRNKWMRILVLFAIAATYVFLASKVEDSTINAQIAHTVLEQIFQKCNSMTPDSTQIWGGLNPKQLEAMKQKKYPEVRLDSENDRLVAYYINSARQGVIVDSSFWDSDNKCILKGEKERFLDLCMISIKGKIRDSIQTYNLQNPNNKAFEKSIDIPYIGLSLPGIFIPALLFILFLSQLLDVTLAMRSLTFILYREGRSNIELASLIAEDKKFHLPSLWLLIKVYTVLGIVSLIAIAYLSWLIFDPQYNLGIDLANVYSSYLFSLNVLCLKVCCVVSLIMVPYQIWAVMKLLKQYRSVWLLN